MKIYFSRLCLSCFLAALVFLPAVSFSQVETFTDLIDGPDFIVDSSVVAFDDKLDSADWNTIDTTYYSKAILVFEINPDIPFYLPDTFFCSLTVEVKIYDSTNTLVSTNVEEMSIGFDTLRNKPYKNKAILYYNNIYRIEAKITNINYQQGNGNLIPPEIFRLRAEISILRLYDFDCSDTPDFISCTYEATHNYQVINWDPFAGATDYDLEWTFYDDSSLVIKDKLNGYVNLDSIFRFNATKITLKGTEATIPLVYPDGYIFYRVRAVKVLDGFQNLFSEWSHDTSDNFRVTWHEESLTWQSSLSFAEEGKRKEVVSYFDGSLRNRQTVTRINQVDTAVVGETIYDFQGRPAVKVLPAPAFDPQIKYYPKFNIDPWGNSYSWANFDTASCGNTPDSMKSDSGASRYYSPENPLYYVAPYKYVPDAEGYPFAITEYTQDNTGRISRQSGVGPYLMFNDSVHRETRYFYGKPSQWQLDRLFGNDVGDSSHYTEEMVIDPNGQISITYKDAHDRVIATALAGTPPPNLIQLPEYMPDDTARTYLLSNNHIEDNSWLSSTSFLVTSKGDFTFYYGLFPDQLKIPNCSNDSICYDCYYDIKISLASTCSPNPYNIEPLVSRSYKNYQIPRNDTIFYDTLCTLPDSALLDSFIVNLEPGSYFVTRQITVSDSALNFYTEKFLRENTCESFANFFDSEMDLLDSSACVTCEECLQQLGDTADFLADFFATWDTVPPVAEDTTKALIIYGEAYSTCMLICNPFDNCNIRKQLMLSDFIPGGQYAKYERQEITDINGVTTTLPISSDESSLLFFKDDHWAFQDVAGNFRPFRDEQGNIIYVDVQGQQKEIQDLNSEEFVTHFQPSWAYAFLKMHPEYCYLKYCETNSASQAFQFNLINTNTYDAALDSGWIDTYGPLYSDPFFMTESGVGDSDRIQTRITNFKTVNIDSAFPPGLNPYPFCHKREFSMWELAVYISIKGILPSGVDLCDTLDINGLCIGDKNLAWMAFRAMYLKIRDSIYVSRENRFVIDTTKCDMADVHGSNCCIGSSLDQYHGLGHSCISGGPLCNQFYFEKTPRFYHVPADSPMHFQDSTAAINWAGNKMDSVCNRICNGHRFYWSRKLLEYCGNIDSTTMDIILDKFQEICEHGCDPEHPIGASSVPSSDNLTPGSFQEVIEQVLGVSSTNASCNALRIDVPRPYDMPGKWNTTQIIYPKPPECVCEKFDSLYILMIIDTAGTTLDSFAIYLAEKYGSQLTIQQLYDIKNHCHDTTCKNMPEAIELPAVLSCASCLPCDSVGNAFDDFRQTYADALAAPDINELLGNYLNHRFGYHLQFEDYVEFLVDCQVDTTGLPGLVTCDSISELFVEYITSASSQSLDDYLDSALNLNYSYIDYSMWIYNCAFDTINFGYIPCDSLLKYRDAFYLTGYPADSFVTWMNDTLTLELSYRQYASWIANCDSTDSIPYVSGMAMRMAHNGSHYSSGSFSSPNQTKSKQTKQSNKKSDKLSKEQLKAEFEKILQKRNSKLGINNTTNPAQQTVPNSSQPSTTQKSVLIKSGKPTSFSPEKFMKSIGKWKPIDNFKSHSSQALNINTLIASSDPNAIIFNESGVEMSEVFEAVPMPPSFCDELADALEVYDSISSGFHPPLALWLNNYLDTNLSYAAWISAISGCSISMPLYSLECDSLELHVDSCQAHVPLCVIAGCLNEASELEFNIHEYLQWFDSCNIEILDCSEIDSAANKYNTFTDISRPPLTVFMHNFFDLNLTYSEWIKLITDCGDSIISSTWGCDSLQAAYIDCAQHHSHSVASCMNEHFSSSFTWTEFTTWMDSCGISYITCEKLTGALSEYNKIDSTLRPPLAIWLNHILDLDFTYELYLEYLENCDLTEPYSTISCDSLSAHFDTCQAHYPLNQAVDCLNDYFDFDFTVSEYLHWMDTCNIHFINCDTLDSIVNVWKMISPIIRPPLTVYLNSHFSLTLSFSDYVLIMHGCNGGLAPSLWSCDSIATLYSICSELPPFEVADCMNDILDYNFTLYDYLQWLDSCSVPYDTTISCVTLAAANEAFPCWQDTMGLFEWFNYYFAVSLPDSVYELALDTCELQPLCCMELHALTGGFTCDSTGYTVYEYLNDTLGVNLSDSFWQSRLDSCLLHNPCDTCHLLEMALIDFPCQDSISIIEWVNNLNGWSLNDSSFNSLLDSCRFAVPCHVTCDMVWLALTEFPCHDSPTIPLLESWLNSYFDFDYSDSTWIVIFDTCDITLPCFLCFGLNSLEDHYPCGSGIPVTTWLNDTLDVNYTEAEWAYIFTYCPFDTNHCLCSIFDTLISSYPCNDSLSLYEWLDLQTGLTYTDAQILMALYECRIEWNRLCTDCDSLHSLESIYPCNSGIPLYVWLNDTLDLSLTQLEWQYIFSYCPVDTSQCICGVLDTLIGNYPCHDTLSITEWINSQTGWGLSDGDMLSWLNYCSITWDTLCFTCDSLLEVETAYPCNSGISINSWLNDTLNLSFSVYEWDQILADCPIDTMHCLCNTLDSLIPLYPCNDSLALYEWVNDQAGWRLSDLDILALLDSCNITWDTLCVPCDSLHLLEVSYPCDLGIPLYAWLNDTLDLSYSNLEWQAILVDCPFDTIHCLCPTLDSLVPLYPCNNPKSLTKWLDIQTGWGLSGSQYLALLDSCDIIWDTLCVKCDSILLAEESYPCNSGIEITSWLNLELGLSYSTLEWSHIFIDCPVDTMHCICPPLDSLVPLYPCNDSLPLYQWLNAQTGWNLPDSAYLAYLDSCNIEWDTICVVCDTLQSYALNYPCNIGVPFTTWLNNELNLSYSDTEWTSIFISCPIDTSHCICLTLDSLLPNYPCQDSLSLADWLELQTGWGWTDTLYLAWIDSCNLDSFWISSCVPSCDSLQALEHSFPCDSSITLEAWLNDTLNLSYTDIEWDSIFSWCPVDTLCGLDSCYILNLYYNQWLSYNPPYSLALWLNFKLHANHTYWEYVYILDSCDITLPLPCDTLDSLVGVYNSLIAPIPYFSLWANHELGLYYTDLEYAAMLDSCNLDTTINPNECDTLQLYIDYFNTFHPAQNFFSWMNSTLGYNYSFFEYQQWLDSCDTVTQVCSYFDSLYTYYVSNSISTPVEDWLNQQSGLNYTFWQYVHMLDGCICFELPCDTLHFVWNILDIMLQPSPPFYLFANNYFGLHYSQSCYEAILDSCSHTPPPTDCDTLILFYSIWEATIPQPDLTTWFNDTLNLSFTIYDYIQWFDDCDTSIFIPCDTLIPLYTYYTQNSITTPFADWMNTHFGISYTLQYYQFMLDSCIDGPTQCDSLNWAVAAFIAQPDTSLDFVDFLNAWLGWNVTLEEYQIALADCHNDTNLYLCDHDWLIDIPIDTIQDNECLDDFIDFAYNNALHNYDLYLDSLRGAFIDNYISHCLNSFGEHFYNDGPFSEYHYTLYYYDQAGNLVQTIPPNGVVPFSHPDTLNEIAYRHANPGAGTAHYQETPYATIYTYNTLNKPTGQQTPDADSAHFYYDRLGRLVFSQNAEQIAHFSLSYTIYDDLGRMVEVGRLDTMPFLTIDDDWARDSAIVNFFIENSYRTEVTHTYYDAPAFNPSADFIQLNLRNRVASVTYEIVYDNDSLTYNSASHYTYDISGNVSTMLQENRMLDPIGQSLKRIDYDYDLVSGKVNYVYYQKDSVDQFTHRYEYDDDNRITHVYTSRDGMLWDEDAGYKYYLHGPLARVELGEQNVQGVDYAYTLQGWMKGINASVNNPEFDMGADGNSLANGFSRDAYGYSLGYFYQDYKQIDPSTKFQADYTASLFGDSSFGSTTNLGLYNGNIRHTVLSMDSMNYPNIGYVYQYDQLNRLKSMRAFADLDSTDNEWGPAAVLDDYKELIDFDPNGNILNYLRRGTSTGSHTIRMDSLNYTYNSGNNKLDHVTDNSGYTSNYPDDIDDGQSGGNYDYDANGNLIADVSEGLTMTWWNNGKLKSVAKASGDTLNFFYDPSGNRIVKKHFNNTTGDTLTTVYVRDAQGNIMATYEWKNADSLRLKELDIYGSSRVGMLTQDTLIGCDGCITATGTGSSSTYTGLKQYELTNHLGNILTTITDKKIYYDSLPHDSIADYSIPEIASQQDYYPFGMLMPERNLSLSNYRIGFNGKEKDDEVKGNGNTIDFGDRIYDSRLGRWLSVDPLQKKYPDMSPYNFASNNPIKFIDIKGQDFGVKVNHDEKTIIVVATVYTTSSQTYNQALKAAGQWNSKTASVEGYTISFQIKVEKPASVSTDQVISTYQTTNFYKSNGKLKEGKVQLFKDLSMRTKALQAAENDEIGNSYAGNKGLNSHNVTGEKFVGGQTINGERADMNNHSEFGNLGTYNDLVAHEIGHFFGLDDEGGGPNFSKGGIMEYKGTDLAAISDDDVKNIINYAKQALNGKTSAKIDAKVKLIESKGKSDGSSPLDVK